MTREEYNAGGRPEKATADWFKHSSNMRNDRRMKVAMKRLGPFGYTLYFWMLETLTESPGIWIKWTAQNRMFLAADFDISEPELDYALATLIQVDLLRSHAGYIYCPALDSNLRKVFERRNNSLKEVRTIIKSDESAIAEIELSVSVFVNNNPFSIDNVDNIRKIRLDKSRSTYPNGYVSKDADGTFDVNQQNFLASLPSGEDVTDAVIVHELPAQMPEEKKSLAAVPKLPSPQSLIDIWNEEVKELGSPIPKVLKCTPKRAKKIRVRMRENIAGDPSVFVKNWRLAVRVCCLHPFLSGADGGWTADLDYMIKSAETFERVFTKYLREINEDEHARLYADFTESEEEDDGQNSNGRAQASA